MKKSELRLMIREIVREELALSIKEVVKEIKSVPIPKPNSKPIQEKNYSKNSVLNDVLNETAQGEDWKQMGGTKYTSERMNELVGSGYADMMNDTPPNGDEVVASMGEDPKKVPDFLKKAMTRDYSDVMKAVDKKKGLSNGR